MLAQIAKLCHAVHGFGAERACWKLRSNSTLPCSPRQEPLGGTGALPPAGQPAERCAGPGALPIHRSAAAAHTQPAGRERMVRSSCAVLMGNRLMAGQPACQPLSSFQAVSRSLSALCVPHGHFIRDLVKALQQLATRGDAGPDANATSAAAMLLIRVIQGVGEKWVLNWWVMDETNSHAAWLSGPAVVFDGWAWWYEQLGAGGVRHGLRTGCSPGPHCCRDVPQPGAAATRGGARVVQGAPQGKLGEGAGGMSRQPTHRKANHCCLVQPSTQPWLASCALPPCAGRRRGAAARRRPACRLICGGVPGRAVRRVALAGAGQPHP